MKVVTLTKPARLFAALPLIFGLATVLESPTAQAAVMQEVDIINGFVDVIRNGVIDAADDLTNVFLWCNDSAPVRVDIINGGVDVTESTVVSALDDLSNCDLTDEDASNVPANNQVDIIDGCIDVTEVAGCTASDDATDIQLFRD